MATCTLRSSENYRCLWRELREKQTIGLTFLTTQQAQNQVSLCYFFIAIFVTVKVLIFLSNYLPIQPPTKGIFFAFAQPDI
jgi:hypothetical protein